MRALFRLGLVLAIVLLAGPAFAAGDAARGRYLAYLGDCAGCHTGPKEKPFSGGLPFHAAFGTVYSTNITPDPETGLGKWSADDFYRALHDGVAPGGKHLYPAFPYTYFQRISRAESDDLFAWIHTLKPVRRPPTPNKLIFPFNLRFGIWFWNQIYLDHNPPRIPAGATAQWTRGEYIVNGLGHCASCHTPKNFLFGDVRGQNRLKGGTVDYWHAPNITGSGADGLGGWSHGELVAFLKTGVNRHARAAGSMLEKVNASTSKMTDADLMAMTVYLKSLKYGEDPALNAPRPERMARGAGLFTAHCQRCHDAAPGMTRVPQAKRGPSLKGDTMLLSRDPTTVIRMILTGGAAPAMPGELPTSLMPGFGHLDDGEIADLATYIRNAWGNRAAPVSAAQVHDLRRTLAGLDDCPGCTK